MDRASLTTSVVCEIGPATVRRLRGSTDESVLSAEIEVAAAVLDGGDEPLALLGGYAVAVDELWRNALEPLLHGVDDAVLIHPSWWPKSRVEAMRAVALPLCGRVSTRARASLVAMLVPDDVLVEVAPHLVVVSAGGGAPLAVETRSGAVEVVADAVALAVLQQTDRAPVWLDGPVGVPGAHPLTGLIGDRLRAAGRQVHRVDDRHLVRAAGRMLDHDADPDALPRRPARRRIAAAACTVLVAAIGAGWCGGHRTDATSPVPATALVEGRVAMEIPAGWTVQRVTAGPGSARVQVVSPTDGESALHMTQSRVHDEDLAAAAAVLRQAFDGQPAGVFVDFHPSDLRAGRPAVTYREVRPGHDIRWAVVVDGTVRISIGCQSAAGAERDIAGACDQAVRSAHEVR